MNKKLLSGVLLGAMLVTSAVTFVSCSKDYDDDIDNLENRMNSVESAMSTLQAQVSAAKWITNLSSTTGGFTVTFSDGSSYTITNGKDGEKGADGVAGKDGTNGTIVSVENGYWVIDGVTTEYLALTGNEISGKAPYVEDGYWYFYNEDGEAVKSDYKAAGAAYAVQDATTGVYTLYVPDEEGEIQSIELPTAASKISGIAFTNDSYRTLTIYKSKEWSSTVLSAIPSSWKGTRALPAAGSYVYGSTGSPVEIQVSPADVAGDIKAYTLVNSKNVTLGLALTADAFNGVISANGLRVRAASNGLYDITADPQVLDKDAAKALEALLTAAGASTTAGTVGYAVTADGIFRSEYKVILATTNDAPKLDNLTVNGDATTTTIGGSGSYSVDVNATNKVTFSKETALYDSYITIDADDREDYGVEIEGNTFKVTENPDRTSGTNNGFDIVVNTIDINGTVAATTVHIDLSSAISSSAQVLDEKLVDVSAKIPGFAFNISSVNAASNSTWRRNVDLAKTDYRLYETYRNGTLSDEVSGVFDKAASTPTALLGYAISQSNGSEATSGSNASSVSFAVTNSFASDASMKLDTKYYVEVTFKNSSKETLNSVIVPVTFTAPSVADAFKLNSAYVKNGVIYAYFYNYSTPATAVELYRYFDEYLEDAALDLAANDEVLTVRTTTYDSADLATISSSMNDTATIDLSSTTGYGQTLNVTASSDNYEGWKYADDDDAKYAFQIKLLSPIEQGSVKAVGSKVELNAADVVNGAKITDSMIKGYDYNNNAYNVVPDEYDSSNSAAWVDGRIASVAITEYDARLLDQAPEIVAASQDANGNTVNGYIQVKASNVVNDTDTTITVKVTDVWGYSVESEVPVAIKVN